MCDDLIDSCRLGGAVDLAELLDPREGPITAARADQLRARLVEHAPAGGGGCVTCGEGLCLTRASAAGALILAGEPLS